MLEQVVHFYYYETFGYVKFHRCNVKGMLMFNYLGKFTIYCKVLFHLWEVGVFGDERTTYYLFMLLVIVTSDCNHLGK